jgi:hypothetical protein
LGWPRPFDDPVIADGEPLITLRDAAEFILRLPAAEQRRPEWQAAIEVVIMAAEDRGPLLHARIGMLRALNRDKPAPPRPPRHAKKFNIIR